MSEILAYCTLMKYDYMRLQDFLIYVEKMDAVYMDYIAEKQEEARGRGGATPSRVGKG